MIFLNPRGEVLLCLRDDSDSIPFPNCWDLLGGSVEPDESVEEAIAREISEEIEFKIDFPPRLFRFSRMTDRDEYTFLQPADLDPERTPLHEGQRLKWFSEAGLRAMDESQVAFGFKRILFDFFDTQRRQGGVA